MPVSTPDRPRFWLRSPVAEVLIMLAAMVSTLMVGAIGLASLPGLAFSAASFAALLIVVLTCAPHFVVLLPAALFPLPLVWAIFPYEVALGLLAVVLLARLLVRGDTAFLRLTAFEAANLAFVGWALFTSFWASDPIELFLGVRRLLEGVLTMWIAYRLAGIARKAWFEASLVLLASVLTLAAFQRRLSYGLGAEGAEVSRTSATDLGWGTANFIATLLLLLTPFLISMLRRDHARWMRWTSAVLVVAIGILQVVIASRAATLLFFVGLLAQLMAQHLKRNLGLIFVTVAGTAFLLSTPIGDRFISRFSELKDLGSIVIRIWFFQEAWRRLVDHLPWGIGLGQGATFPDKLQNNDPHNYWLVIGPELGVIGLILWVVVLFVLWRQIRAVSRTPGWTGIGIALQVSFWLSQLHTVVEPTFQGVQYQFVYFWLFAGYLGYHRHERDQGRGPAASISR